jgi:hypothetical protein
LVSSMHCMTSATRFFRSSTEKQGKYFEERSMTRPVCLNPVHNAIALIIGLNCDEWPNDQREG